MTRLGIAVVLVLVAAVPSQAQTARPAPRRATRQDEGVRVRAFVDVGGRTFTASQSFEAVLGSSRGVIFGAGAEALIGRHLFASFGVSKFQHDGQRVAVVDGTAFPLGIDTTVSVVPIEVSGGWRFSAPRRSVTPYLGGGASFHRYKETSKFAAAGEDAQFTKPGAQVLGGAEWRPSRRSWLGIAGEAAWMMVPNAFDDAPTSAAAAFDEHDLGGAVFRVKVVIGR